MITATPYRRLRALKANKSTRFTTHGKERLGERFKIQEDELCAQLDAGLFVPLGRERERRNVAHRLFFSRDDARWGVAVQDRKTFDVLTVVNLEIYARMHRKVHPLEKRQAKRAVHWVPEDDPPTTPFPAAQANIVCEDSVAAAA